jgi:hypothetical protein
VLEEWRILDAKIPTQKQTSRCHVAGDFNEKTQEMDVEIRK